jgi:aminopeptidase YwaD
MITAEERQLQFEIKGRNALEHIERLCEFGFRFIGSEGDRRAIAYVEECFGAYGLEVERTPIRVPTFEERCVELVLTDTGTALQGIAPYFTAPGPRGGLRGELVYVGDGTEEDYQGLDVTGKIVVLAESGLGYSRFWLGTFSELAANHGAIGMVVVHPFPWPYRMSMEAGNSNLQQRFVKRQVPAVSISALDGLKLMQHIGSGSANAFLNVETAIYDADSLVISGVVKGSERPHERVAMIGHRDNGFPPGANDNGSGAGCLLELARVFSTRKPKRTLEFISSTAEEGATIGAWSYVQAHKDRLADMKALIDMDMFGTGGRLNLVETGNWPDTGALEHPEWLNRAIEELADDLGYHVGRMTTTWGIAEEARFLEAGVPAAWFWKPDDMYYHSAHDTPDKVDANSLKAVADLTAITAWRLANQ